MCGLLHDVGIAAGLLVFGEAKRGESPPAYDDILASIETAHEEASSALGKAWNLPPDVQLVLTHHHHFAIDGRVHPLAAAVCLADWLATEANAATGYEVTASAGQRAAQELRLSEHDVHRLSAQARTLAATL